MQLFIIIVLIAAGAIALTREVYSAYERKHKHVDTDKPKDNMTLQQDSSAQNPEVLLPEERVGTRELILKTLRGMGCQPEIRDDDMYSIGFQYQDAYFVMIVNDTKLLVDMAFFGWYSCPLENNLDGLSAVQKAVNNTNSRINGCTVFYTIHPEENEISVHSHCRMLIQRENTTLKEYFNVTLFEFFRVRNQVTLEIQRILDKENV